MKERDTAIDTVAGILILNMVVYHYSPIEAQKYLGFFIPWFFYKAGLFYKEIPIKESFVKIKKLVIPLVVFTFLGYVLHSIKIFQDGDRNIIHYTLTPIKEFLSGSAIEGNLPLWFLSTLILTRLSYNYLVHNYLSGGGVVFPIIVILHFAGLGLPIIISNVANGLFFYSLGNIVKNRQVNNRLVLLAIVVTIVIALFAIPKATVLGNEIFEGNYFVWLIYSIFGCIAIGSVFRILPFRLTILPFIGRNSIVILVTHWIILEIVNIFLECIHDMQFPDSMRIIVLYAVFIAGELIFIRLFKNKRFRWVVGN